MDCKGVCFGNYTGQCDILMKSDNSTFWVDFGFDPSEQIASSDVVIHNESTSTLFQFHVGPFSGRLSEYTLINNAIPPTVQYEFFHLQNGSLVSTLPENLVFYGNDTVVVRLTSSVEKLILYSNQYLYSHMSRHLSVKLPCGRNA